MQFTYPLELSEPEKVIEDSERLFGMTSYEAMYTERIMEIPRTLENLWLVSCWYCALCQLAEQGSKLPWES
jgi:hypothetical protein